MVLASNTIYTIDTDIGNTPSKQRKVHHEQREHTSQHALRTAMPCEYDGVERCSTIQPFERDTVDLDLPVRGSVLHFRHLTEAARHPAPRLAWQKIMQGVIANSWGKELHGG